MTTKHELHRHRPDVDEMAGLPLEYRKQPPHDVPSLEQQALRLNTFALLATAIGYALGLAMLALLVHITLRMI